MAGACLAFLAFRCAIAGEFAVSPVRLELGADARSGVIAVTNDGKDKLSFQMSAMEWTQDGSGTDQYSETRDLVFFPKIMAVEPGQEGVVRVGVRNPLVPVEKTYRLFIEELPGAAKSGPGVQVSVLVRFGAAIFIKPLKVQDGLEIEGLSLGKGTLSFSARNSGNRHQMVQGVQLKGVDATGQETYALTLADRYLLAGTVKPYTTSISADQCRKIASLEIEVKTDKVSAKGRLDVTRALCP